MAISGKIVPLALALMAMMPQYALALTADQVYERVKDSVVVVKAYDREGKAIGLGSGVMLPSGDIVTNYHVVKAGVKYTVGQKGKTAPAFLQGSDSDKDLALLLAPGLTATPARLGQTSRLKVGEPVYAVGAPQGLELSFSEGIVSQLRGGPPPIIQTTVAISPGSSGGGLFNAQGELVGLTTFYLKEGQGLNFALPVEWVGQFAGEKIRECPREKWLGIHEPGKARTLFKAGDLKGLLAHFCQWTRAEPGDSRAWYNLGISYTLLDRHQEAIEAFRESLRLKPDNANAWNYLGFSYSKQGRHREMIEAFRESLRLDPDKPFNWFELGLAYEELGRHQEAIESYRESLRLFSYNNFAWYNLGRVYSKQGRYREAIEAYQEALGLEPDDAAAWNNLARAYALSGNRSAALEAVKELRRYDPQKADELFNFIMKP